jgi:glutaredoxin
MDDHYYVWALSDCPFCLQAVEELVKQKTFFSTFVMDEQRDELNALKKAREWSTVPLIVVKEGNGKEKLIGGFTDLKKWFETSEEK